MSTYFAILTEVGEAKLANAIALGQTLKLKNMAVGDGNGTLPLPVRTQKALVREVRRAGLNQLSIDPANASQIIVEQVLPEEVGGWWIREIGIYDEAGDLCAVANCPPSYKPLMAEGSGRTQVVRVVLIVASTAAIELKIDPAIVLATRKYVDDRDIVVRGYSDAQMAAHLAAADPHPQYSMRTVSTLPKFDTSTKLANAAFVQQAQGNMVRCIEVSETRTLTADDIGCALYFTATGRFINIPEPQQIGIPGNSGKCVKFFGLNYSGTIVPALAVSIGFDVANVPSVTVKPGQSITLMATGSSRWQVIESTADMSRNPDFADYFNNLAPTQAKLSANKKIATTEFVQQEMGNIVGSGALSASRSLMVSDLGKGFYFSGDNVVFTLPKPGDLGIATNSGRCVHFFGFGGKTGRLAPAAGVSLNYDVAGVASIEVKAGQYVTLVATGDAIWQVIDSTAEMWRNPDFANYFNNVAPTPPKFSADTRIATTEFVQQSLGSFSGYDIIAGSRAVTPADIGKVLWFNAAGYTLTLPRPIDLLSGGQIAGRSIKVFAASVSGTVVPAAGAIFSFNVSQVPSVQVKPGQSVTLTAISNASWQILDSTADMGRNADFFASLEGNGHFKLPSGVLVQRGSGITSEGLADITFPVSFPKSCSQVLVTESAAGAWSAARFSCVGSYQKSLTGAKVKAITYSSGTYIQGVVIFDWLAIGS
jgi:hypothetical protein